MHPEWRFRLQINHIDAVKSSIEEGLGVSFISNRAIDRELQSGTLAIVPVEGVNLRRPICMLTNAHNLGSKAAILLAKHITNHALQMLTSAELPAASARSGKRSNVSDDNLIELGRVAFPFGDNLVRSPNL